MSSFEGSLAVLLPEAGRLITKRLEERLRVFHLTLAQFEILEMLWTSSAGAISQKSIIEMRGVEAATVGTTLSRLERDGWVMRLPDPDDRRGKLVVATEKACERRDYIRVAIVQLEIELQDFLDIKTELKGIIARFRNDDRGDLGGGRGVIPR